MTNTHLEQHRVSTLGPSETSPTREQLASKWFVSSCIVTPRTHFTSALIGKGHILGGGWSKIEVTQLRATFGRSAVSSPSQASCFFAMSTPHDLPQRRLGAIATGRTPRAELRIKQNFRSDF